MLRHSPRKRKQAFPVEPSEKTLETLQNMRTDQLSPRSDWRRSNVVHNRMQIFSDNQGELMTMGQMRAMQQAAAAERDSMRLHEEAEEDAKDGRHHLPPHHLEDGDIEVEEEVEVEEEDIDIDVDGAASDERQEQVVEEYVGHEGFNLNEYDDADNIQVNRYGQEIGRKRPGYRMAMESDGYRPPRLSEYGTSEWTQQAAMSKQLFRSNNTQRRPPVYLRTAEHASFKQRLLPVAVARHAQPPMLHPKLQREYEKSGGQKARNIPSPQWRALQNHKTSLVNLYEGLTEEQKRNFLPFLSEEDRETLILPRPPSTFEMAGGVRGRGRGGGHAANQNHNKFVMSRVRAREGDVTHQQTVRIPSEFAPEGAEVLLSRGDDGKSRILAMMPVEDGSEGGRMNRNGNASPPRKRPHMEGEEDRTGADADGATESSPMDPDMPELEPEKEALEQKKEADRRARDRAAAIAAISGRTEQQEEVNKGWEGIGCAMPEGDDVDVENLEESIMHDRRRDGHTSHEDLEMQEDDEMSDGGEMTQMSQMSMGGVRGRRIITNEAKRRQSLFYVPELDIYADYPDFPLSCNPRSKQGLKLCESCNQYMRKSIYYHHQRTIREHGSCSAMTPRRFDCGVPMCVARLPTIEKLCTHMADVHDMPTDVNEQDFENEMDFAEWLTELESKGGNFRMSRGNKAGKNGIVRYFRCNRVSQPTRKKDTEELAMNESNRLLLGNALEEGALEQDGAGGLRRTRGPKAPLLRTEKVCTAFYRKQEHADGRISVRFCDFHLHEDIRVKIPDAARDRIVEMLKKRLPMPVIVEVIKFESELFAARGTEAERRVYRINEKDVRNTYCAHQARKRKSALNEGDGEVAELTDTEQRFLAAFEKAEGRGVRDIAKGNKETLERRRRRDALRDRHEKIGRFMRTERFIECTEDQLDQMDELYAELGSLVSPHEPRLRRKDAEDEDVDVDMDMESAADISLGAANEENYEEDKADDGKLLSPAHRKIIRSRVSGGGEGEVVEASPVLKLDRQPAPYPSDVEQVSPSSTNPPPGSETPSTTTAKRRGRPPFKRNMAGEAPAPPTIVDALASNLDSDEGGVVKEEEESSTPRGEIRMRSGRISKPKVLIGE